MPGPGGGTRTPALPEESAPFSFVKTKENCRGRSKENRIYEQASRLSVNTGVVRTGLVGIDGPVDLALMLLSRRTAFPHNAPGG